MITLYGISNCDTVKRARKWLDKHGIDYQFHDFRNDGLAQETVEYWINTLGWQSVVNKRSTTWRGLSKTVQGNMDAITALAEIMKQPTLVKRPVLDTDQILLTGFNETDYSDVFNL